MKKAICDYLKRPMPKATAMSLSIIPTAALLVGFELLGLHIGEMVPVYKNLIQGSAICIACLGASFSIAVPHFVEDAIDAC